MEREDKERCFDQVKSGALSHQVNKPKETCKSFCFIFHFYHPCMWIGNVFGHVCLYVYLSVFLSVQAINFEPLDI